MGGIVVIDFRELAHRNLRCGTPLLLDRGLAFASDVRGVLAERRLGPIRVAITDRCEKGGVLLTYGHAVVPSQKAVGPRANEVDRRHRQLQQPIPRGASDRPVEPHVELKERRERLVVDHRFFEGRGYRRKILVRPAFRGKAHARSLHDVARLVDLRDRDCPGLEPKTKRLPDGLGHHVRLRRHDEVPALRTPQGLNETLTSQDANRLAHRRAAHTEVAGHLRLGRESVSGLNPAVDEGVADLGGYRLGRSMRLDMLAPEPLAPWAAVGAVTINGCGFAVYRNDAGAVLHDFPSDQAGFDHSRRGDGQTIRWTF